MLYVDSSALVKHYIREAGTDSLNAKLTEESTRNASVFVSTLAYAEILAAFARRLREKLLTKLEASELFHHFQDDWMFELNHVELSASVQGFIPRLVENYPLRGPDVVHLASALSVRGSLRLGQQSGTPSSIITFASSDEQLKNAASAEGLAVFDPESTP